MSKPRISVVIPTCNRNDLLALCLDCLAPGAQNLPSSDYEVIVTDDGSTSTAQQMISEKYPWAHWTQGPRRGPAANRNHGVKQARGEWIAFTDDDCLPKPQWLQAFDDAIEPQTLVYEGKTTCEAGLKSPLETAPVNLEGGYLWSCNMMVQKVLFESMTGFDEGFPVPCNEDVEFRERLDRYGRVFRFVGRAVVDHPPRPQVMGIAMGKRGESHVRLWYARGNRKPARVDMIVYLLLFRLREIRWKPLSFESLVWFGSTFVELVFISANLSNWNRRHRFAYRKCDIVDAKTSQKKRDHSRFTYPMKHIKFDPTWPKSWKQSYAYDQLEVYDGNGDKGYIYAYDVRKRHTLNMIKKVAPAGAKILDIAAAQGNFTLTLAEMGYEVTWNDLRVELMDYVKLKHEYGNVHYAPGNAFDLGFENEFDVVLITEIIEHVAHPDQFLESVAHIVKPGGHIVMTTPNGAYFLNDLPKFSQCTDPSQFESIQFKPNSDGHIFLLHTDELPDLADKAGLTMESVQLFTNPLTNGHIKTGLLLKVAPPRLVRLIERSLSLLPMPLRRKFHTGMGVIFKRPS